MTVITPKAGPGGTGNTTETCLQIQFLMAAAGTRDVTSHRMNSRGCAESPRGLGNVAVSYPYVKAVEHLLHCIRSSAFAAVSPNRPARRPASRP